MRLEASFSLRPSEGQRSSVEEHPCFMWISAQKKTFNFKIQGDVPQQNDFNQKEVLDEQQLLTQERNFTDVQVGADCSQIKEEQEDVCISQEGEQFGLKQETPTSDEESKQDLLGMATF
ncbi:uncharacterized protein KZ484_016323 [Pholidichthys leucotaenia]